MSGRAFRAQLVMQGRARALRLLASLGGCAAHAGKVRSRPPQGATTSSHLGLIDVREGIEQASFRLAGTRLRDVYGQEVTGKRVDEVYCGDCADYWRRIHARVVEAGQPLHGVVRGPAAGRDHIVLFWMRLPLSEDGGKVDRILCHDVVGPAETARSEVERSLLHYPRLSRKSGR